MLISFMCLWVKRSRTLSVTLLRKNHQIAEPMKTPRTRRLLPRWLLAEWSPTPAKIAMNDKIVVGLVRVRKNVDIYSLIKPSSLISALFSAGLEIIVL